jgi:hypothetical protein
MALAGFSPTIKSLVFLTIYRAWLGREDHRLSTHRGEAPSQVYCSRYEEIGTTGPALSGPFDALDRSPTRWYKDHPRWSRKAL